jgi:hypothetical membrane protein
MTRTAPAEAELLKAIRLARLAIVQFVILCLLSIVLFPGKFQFLENYLSELGIFYTLYSPHAWLFNGSLIALGCGLFALFRSLVRAMADQFDDLRVCGVTGMAAAIAIIFIGLIPLNVSDGLHTLAMSLWLLFTVLTLAFWANWHRLERGGRPPSLGKLGVAAIVVYPVAVMFGRGPALQKVIVLLSVISLMWFSVELEQTVQSGIPRRWQSTRRRQRSPGWSDLALGGRTHKSSGGTKVSGIVYRPNGS